MRIKGQKLTVAQRNNLKDKGVADDILNNYLLKKIKHVCRDGNKSPSRLKDKIEIYEMIHKETGHITEISVREV